MYSSQTSTGTATTNCVLNSAAQGPAKPLDSLPNLGLIDCGVAKQQAAATQRLQRVGRKRGSIDTGAGGTIRAIGIAYPVRQPADQMHARLGRVELKHAG